MTRLRTLLIVPALAAALLMSGLAAASAGAGVVDDLLTEFAATGAGPFDGNRGKTMWSEIHVDAKTGQERKCATCHTADLSVVGKHAKTGKAIKPLAPSANPERLTELKKIRKWFKRNCKWTVGRECTPQEKGDFLTFIQSR